MKPIPSLQAHLFERKQSKFGLILKIKIIINISDQQEPHMNSEKTKTAGLPCVYCCSIR